MNTTRFIKRLFCLLALLCMAVVVRGTEMTYTTSGGTVMYFTVLSEDDKTCMLGVDGYNCFKNVTPSETDIVIPSEVSGYAVVKINLTAFRNSGVTSLDIPKSVKVIDDGAFYYTPQLADITLRNPDLDADYPSTLFTVSFGEQFASNFKLHCSEGLVLAVKEQLFKSNHYLSNWDAANIDSQGVDLEVGDITLAKIDVINDETGEVVGSRILTAFITSVAEGARTCVIYNPPTGKSYGESDIMKEGKSAWYQGKITDFAEGKLRFPNAYTDSKGKAYTITTIGAYALSEFDNKISGIRLPAHLNYLGVKALNGLPYLTGSVVIPASVRQMGSPDVSRAEIFGKDYYGSVYPSGLFFMHTSAENLDWYDTDAGVSFSYTTYQGSSRSNVTLYVCEDIYNKIRGTNGTTRYSYTSGFYSWYEGNYYTMGYVQVFDPSTAGMEWSTDALILDASGKLDDINEDGEVNEDDMPYVYNPFNLPLTYTSSDEQVVTVDAEGKMTIGSDVGEAIVTASFAGSEEDMIGAVSVEMTVVRRGRPRLGNQTNQNPYNTLRTLSGKTRLVLQEDNYMENCMWIMPHMMTNNNYLYNSVYWQSNNFYNLTEWFYFDNNYHCLQLGYNPAELSPNWGVDGYSEPPLTCGGMLSVRVPAGKGKLVVRGYTESEDAIMGVEVAGCTPMNICGGDGPTDHVYEYETQEEAYAYIYGVTLSPYGRHGYVKSITFCPEGSEDEEAVMLSIAGTPITGDREYTLITGGSGSVKVKWKAIESQAGGYGEGSGEEGEEYDDEEEAGADTYPVITLTNVDYTTSNGVPFIEATMCPKVVIKLVGNNTISAPGAAGAISTGTYKGSPWMTTNLFIESADEETPATLTIRPTSSAGINVYGNYTRMDHFIGDIQGIDYGVYLGSNSCYLGETMDLTMQGGTLAFSQPPLSLLESNLAVLAPKDGEYDDEQGTFCLKNWEKSADPETGEDIWKLTSVELVKSLHLGQYLQPIKEEKTIDLSQNPSEDGNLKGVVINDVFFNLDVEEDGEGFDSEDQCIIINKGSDDTYTSNWTNPDIMSEEWLKSFHGIILKVQGEGKVEVDCQTLGTNGVRVLLSNSYEPKEFNLSERGTIEVAYNTPSPINIYIYAPTNNNGRAMARHRVQAGDNAVKIWDITIKPSIITFGGPGYATYFNRNKVRLAAGVKAYVIPGLNGDVLTTELIADGDDEENNIVPEYVPVLLSGATGQSVPVSLTNTACDNYQGENLLVGHDDTEGQYQISNLRNGDYYYKLTYDAATHTQFGFYWGTDDGSSFIATPHRAYLVLTKEQGARMNGFVLEGHIQDGVAVVEKTAVPARQLWHTLDGRLLQEKPSQRGVYLYNGRKVVVN